MIAGLYPLCRSITGDGVRQTLRLLQERIPIEMQEVPSGTQVFDWTVPREWNIRDAYVKDAQGQKVIDFQQCNLHVVNYSVPVHRKMPLSDLRNHLHSMVDHPNWIPYKTTYYKENWGFCLSQKTLDQLTDGDYEVFIDSELKAGHLTFGELVLPGQSSDEVLLSCHICHPSLCNDNLSGVAIATLLAEHLMTVPRRYTYRFLFIPGTIGAIAWLARNSETVDRIRHGLVLTGLGDPGPMTYKKSRIGDAPIDRSVVQMLRHSGLPHSILEFSPYGYDERQYCSPGFNLPVGRLSRTPFGEYPEYHSSADNLDFVQPSVLGESFGLLWETVQILENDRTYLNLSPYGEPQLGKRGLYESIPSDAMALLWVLNLSDGSQSLLDIAERSGLSFSSVLSAKDVLVRNELLQEMEPLP
jgi:aminopeptidase-like protein